MTTRRLIMTVALFVGAIYGTALAQDQTLIVAEPLKACAASVANPLAMTEGEAETLIVQALSHDGTTYAIDPNTYYLLHVVRYANGQMVVESQDWYVYYQPWMGSQGVAAHLLDPRVKKHFSEARVFGSHNVAMVYLHLNVRTVPADAAIGATMPFFINQARHDEGADHNAFMQSVQGLEQRLPPSTVTSATTWATHPLGPTGAAIPAAAGASPEVIRGARLRAEEYMQALRLHNDEITSQLNLIDRNTGLEVASLSNSLLTLNQYGPLSTLTYKIAVTKKVPAPLQNLKAAALFITGHGGAVKVAVDVTATPPLCAGQEVRVEPLPSDMQVTALTGHDKEEKELSKQLFDNERKYHVDISFALPLKTHSDLSLDSSGGQITAKKVEKTDLFAVANLSPWPYDTKKPQFQLLPVFLYGMPITGKPLKHHLLAVGIGLNKVQVFAGIRFDRKEDVSATTADNVTTGTLATPATPKKWNATFAWGINLPVTTVVDLFKTKK